MLRSLLGDFNLPELLSAQWLLGIVLFVRKRWLAHHVGLAMFRSPNGWFVCCHGSHRLCS